MAAQNAGDLGPVRLQGRFHLAAVELRLPVAQQAPDARQLGQQHMALGQQPGQGAQGRRTRSGSTAVRRAARARAPMAS
jgi:hypothetical protein